ncbi:MAG: hypothetical protein KDI54_18225, partial [Gammaproteobacteria bacterium]|nr:hypothetical protein [Gammaproteobacteria bacterium]
KLLRHIRPESRILHEISGLDDSRAEIAAVAVVVNLMCPKILVNANCSHYYLFGRIQMRSLLGMDLSILDQ